MALLPTRLVSGNGKRSNKSILTDHQLIWFHCSSNNTIRNGYGSRIILFSHNSCDHIVSYQGKPGPEIRCEHVLRLSELPSMDITHCIHSRCSFKYPSTRLVVFFFSKCDPLLIGPDSLALVQSMGSHRWNLDSIYRRHPICRCDDLGCQCVGGSYEENYRHCALSYWIWTGKYYLSAIIPAGVEGGFLI